MRTWALPLLRCVRCGAGGLECDSESCRCSECEAIFPVDEDVANFLDRPHPTVAREIEAVASLDSRNPETRSRILELVGDLDGGACSPEDPRLDEFPSFGEYFGAHCRVREMLAACEPAGGSIVIELGADHCLHSGALLDAGCHVVAVDITDHLSLAPRAESQALCRVRADMNRLPIADGAANLVWATACVHHSWSLETTFREAHRVLSPGGRFVLVNEPMPALPRYLLFGLGRGFGREQRRLGINETLHPRSTWVRAAREAGFAPRLMRPALSDGDLRSKLDEYRLPAGLAPLLRSLAGPLQVSIHMVAEARSA
ncbi:MAG: class I SAM-dependent methyltransferase [Thermoanaerobaculia bacterium]